MAIGPRFFQNFFLRKGPWLSLGSEEKASLQLRKFAGTTEFFFGPRNKLV